jgi:hypothetical protein
MHTTAEIAKMGPEAVWLLTDTGFLLAEIENRRRAGLASSRITDEDRKTLEKINRHEEFISIKRA